jgi:hypothetical protein
MYGYEEYSDISPEQLLQKVTQQQIFEFVLDRTFNFEDKYLSPFRVDTRPGCRFEERSDGTILFIDFGEKHIRPHKTHRTCFAMVMDKYDCNLTKAIHIILSKFNLSANSSDYSIVTVPTINYTHSKHNDLPVIFECTKAEFNNSNIYFWNQFIIKTQHLIEDNVFSASKIVINNPNKKKVSTFRPYGHCYVIDFIDAIKIYQPYSIDYKWMTNCNENHIGNIDNLPQEGEHLIIASSYKDHRVLRNIGYDNVIWLHNEGAIPSKYILESLVKRFKLITIFYDSDLAGIKAARTLSGVLNEIRKDCSRVIFLPRYQAILNRYGYYLKDIGMYVHKEGRQELIKLLKHIKL